MKTQEAPALVQLKPPVRPQRQQMDGGEPWVDTIRLLAEGGKDTRDWLKHMVDQYSWDAYVNELEFE